MAQEAIIFSSTKGGKVQDIFGIMIIPAEIR